MQGTIGRRIAQPWWLGLHVLAAVSLLGLALLGQVPAEVAGWLPRPLTAGRPERGRRRTVQGGCWCTGWRALGDYLGQSWRPVLVRSLLLWGLWAWCGGWGPAWLRLLPWVLWLWQGLGAGWPRLRQCALWQMVEGGLWQGQRELLVGYLAVALSGRPVAVGCLGVAAGRGEARHATEPWVQVTRQADGRYQAEMYGHFTLSVADDHPFRMRLLVLFLSLLDAPDAHRASRRTHDGRMPVVRHVQLAAAVGVT